MNARLDLLDISGDSLLDRLKSLLASKSHLLSLKRLDSFVISCFRGRLNLFGIRFSFAKLFLGVLDFPGLVLSFSFEILDFCFEFVDARL